MLWTDTYPVSITDLLVFDTDAQRVATAEQVDLQGCIVSAYSRAGAALLANTQTLAPASDAGAGHLAAVMQGLYNGAAMASSIRLGQIVASHYLRDSYSPLQRWLAYMAIEDLYRKAFSRKVEDKYQAKLLVMRTEAESAWAAVWDSGLPVIQIPLPAPGARFEDGVGDWAVSALSGVSSGGAAGGAFRVAITWTASSVESHPSEILSYAVASGNALRVSIAALNPPTGTAVGETAYRTGLTVSATGWHVYVGGSSGTMYRQTNAPVAIGTKSYTMPGDPALSGVPMGRGQQADTRLAMIRMAFRA